MNPAQLAEHYTSPVPPMDNPLFDGFWKGCREGEMCLPRCGGCGKFHWYPMYRCPYCGGASLAYEAVGNGATLFTWAVIRRAMHPALVSRLGDIVALVIPDGAPNVRLVTNIIGAEPEDLRKGLSVEADFVQVRGDLSFALPVYRLRVA
jgi:uncharacterized OB-fold protein